MNKDSALRPRLHFTPEKNWMNDPNGCVYFNNTWHLFYQHHPHSNVWGPMHWGHAVSTDLMHWEEQNIALYPDERTGMAFSGTIVIDGDRLAAFYTGHLGDVSGRERQQQCMAVSTDGGQNWIPYKNNPVIESNLADFRDPKVFYHAPSESWIMVVVAGFEIQIYRSKNLTDWSFASRFSGYGIKNRIWECPDLFPLKTREGKEVWILVISYLDREPDKSELPKASPVQYFPGTFDGYEFKTDEPEEKVNHLDYGIDFYAVQSYNGLEEQGRRVWIGWANHWYYSTETPTETWRGTMSLPREVFLGERDGGLRLCQRPVRELEDMRSRPLDLELTGKNVITLPRNSPVELVIDRAESFDISVHYDNGEYLTLAWSCRQGELLIDRSRIRQSRFHKKYPPVLRKKLPGRTEEQTEADFRIILDASILEIFALGGEYCFCSQIFPGGPALQLEYSLNALHKREQAGASGDGISGGENKTGGVLYVLDKNVDMSSLGAQNIK